MTTRVTVPTDPPAVKRENTYRLPNHVCATCGRTTAASRHNPNGGMGDDHSRCKRDERGRLLVEA